MNRDFTDVDPLIIYRCKNKLCRHTFQPSSTILVEEQIVFFECPLCGSRYEAPFTYVSGIADQEIIMLLERPRMTFIGTKIVSS
ncbi:MAG: hypothetical protein JXA54_05805 [Candidatus Heimdallarchaeota archaeon]|nr:hypothetical protein [Candidatus Heimdallarchaeota archaeon]